MTEDIWAEVAGRLLDRTLGLKKGESITVETWDNGLRFALEVVRQARRKGAIPLLLLEDEATFLKGVAEMPKESTGLMGKHEYGLLSGTDAYVFIPGPPLGAFYKGISREQYAESTKYNESWYKAAKKARLRGARLPFGYVGRDFAKLAGTNEKVMIRGHLEAALADLNKISQTGKALAAKLQDGREAVVSTRSSRIVFSLKGDLELEDGLVDQDDLREGLNMTYLPPGYVLKGVAKGSATGKIAVTRSLSSGGMIEDGVLEFEKGRLRKWSSERSKDSLDKVLGGGNLPLECFAVGLNPRLNYGLGLDRFVKGAISFYGFGFTAVCRKASVRVAGRKLVDEGRVLL